MVAMKEDLGIAYVLPQRPLGMGSTRVKIASNCALLMLRGSLEAAAGPSQICLETKGGCDMMQWAMEMEMESNRLLADA